MIFLKIYKGHRIYIVSTGNFIISYLHSFSIWKRNFKTLKSAKRFITINHKKLIKR